MRPDPLVGFLIHNTIHSRSGHTAPMHRDFSDLLHAGMWADGSYAVCGRTQMYHRLLLVQCLMYIGATVQHNQSSQTVNNTCTEYRMNTYSNGQLRARRPPRHRAAVTVSLIAADQASYPSTRAQLGARAPAYALIPQPPSDPARLATRSALGGSITALANRGLASPAAACSVLNAHDK